MDKSTRVLRNDETTHKCKKNSHHFLFRVFYFESFSTVPTTLTAICANTDSESVAAAALWGEIRGRSHRTYSPFQTARQSCGLETCFCWTIFNLTHLKKTASGHVRQSDVCTMTNKIMQIYSILPLNHPTFYEMIHLSSTRVNKMTKISIHAMSHHVSVLSLNN